MLSALRLTTSAAAALAALLLALLLAPSARAGGATYCVTCTNPDQTYLCHVTGEGSRQNDAFKLYCVVRTAKEGNHASCSASGKVENCNGLAKVYSYDGPSLPSEVAQNPRVKKLMDRVARDNEAFAKPKGYAPKTMAELTGRAVSASRQRWRSAFGSAPAPQQSVAPDGPTATPQATTQSRAPLPLAHTPAAPVETASLPPETASPPRESRSRVRQAAQNAGSAVGDFARTSYRCFRSLFRNCSGDAND